MTGRGCDRCATTVIIPFYDRYIPRAQAMAEFNVKLRRDVRVTPVMLSIRDGLTLVRRVA